MFKKLAEGLADKFAINANDENMSELVMNMIAEYEPEDIE
jgi:hypothetical protein